MIDISVSSLNDTLSDLVSQLGAIGPGKAPSVEDAFRVSSHIIADTWKNYMMGAPIVGSPYRIKSPTGGLARSIKEKKEGSFRYRIYSDSEIMNYLEHGTKRLDMKTTHPFGPKSRQGKNGPYLIIPFRHGSPKALKNPMPSPLYSMIRKAIKKGEFEKSRVTSNEAYKSPNAVNQDPTGKAQKKHDFAMVSRKGYQWGGRLKGLPEELKNYEGMVAMDTSSGKASSSGYFTFRVISVNSKKNSWIKPAQPAMNITEYVVKNTQDQIEELMEFAIRKDLGL